MAKNRAVGLDIGSRTVTVAVAATKGGRTQVTNYGQAELPEDAVREGEILQPEAVADTIRTLLKDTGVKEKKVNLGIANQRLHGIGRLGRIRQPVAALVETHHAQPLGQQRDERVPDPQVGAERIGQHQHAAIFRALVADVQADAGYGDCLHDASSRPDRALALFCHGKSPMKNITS